MKSIYSSALVFALGFSLLGAVLTAPSLQAQDWPDWLGVNRDGVTTESVVNRDWKTKPPAVLWTAELGIGFSCFTVVDGRVYSMGFREGIERVFCFDAATGKSIWTHEYPSELLDRFYEGGPGSTPVVHEGKVYTIGKIGQVFCLDAKTGTVVWEENIPKLTGVEVPEWGFAGSVLIWGNLCMLDAGHFISLDKQTGRFMWKTKEMHAVGYGSPLHFTEGGADYVAHLNNSGLLILRLASGEETDFLAWETSYATNGTTPIYRDGQLFISTAYNKGCALLNVEDGKLEEVYREQSAMRNQMANSILVGDFLYGFDRKQSPRRLVKLKCIEWATGKERWAKGGMGIGSLLKAGEDLIVLTDEGILSLVKPTPEALTEITRTDILDGRCWTMPVLSNGRLYARNAAGHMVCLDMK